MDFDDLGDLDRFRDGLYEKGRSDGIKEAEGKNYDDNYNTGLAYGKQWASEFAEFKAMIDGVKQKIKTSSNSLLKSQKVVQLIEQLQKVIEESYPPKDELQSIESGRTEARKKYKILLAMLGLKKGQQERDENMSF